MSSDGLGVANVRIGRLVPPATPADIGELGRLLIEAVEEGRCGELRGANWRALWQRAGGAA